MKKYLIALFLVCNACLLAGWQLGTPGTIPSSSSQSDLVGLAYYPNTKQVVAAWSQPTTELPFYSVYNGTSWSPALPFLASNTIGAFNVVLQSFPFKKMIVAAWIATNSTPLPNQPYYSTFNGATWSTPLAIESANEATGISMTYDKVNKRIVAAWSLVTVSIGTTPLYAIFDSSLTWSTPQSITLSYNGVTGVNLTYNKTTQEVFAAFVNNTGSPYFVSQPMYSIFNVHTSTWSTAGQIPIDGLGTDVDDQVSIASSSNSNLVVAGWAATSGTNPIYGNQYSGSWALSAFPASMYGSSGAADNVNFGVNKVNGDIFYVWSDSSSDFPYYGITAPATGGTIPRGLTTTLDVNITYDEQSAQMIAVWTDRTSNQVYYNTYQ